MSVQTPHATFAQQHPDTVAPFLYKSQGLPIHVPVMTKSGTISVRLDQVLNLDCIETDMRLLIHKPVPPLVFSMQMEQGSNSNYCHPIIALFIHTWNLILVTLLAWLSN